MRTATVRLQLESDAVFMEIDKIWALRDKTKGVLTKVTILKRRLLKLEAKFRQSSKYGTAGNVR